jgi:hypothetical protein
MKLHRELKHKSEDIQDAVLMDVVSASRAGVSDTRSASSRSCPALTHIAERRAAKLQPARRIGRLLNHLVGADKQPWRQGDAEGPRGLEVDQ